MGASFFVVLWHVLSLPVWFLVEVFAKKPWKWSVYSSIAITSFIPLLTLIAFALGSVLFGLIALLVVQCGLLALAVASLISSAIMIAPVALLLTIFIYAIYKFAVLAARTLRWALAFPTKIFTHIQQELRRILASVSVITRDLCFGENFKKKRRKVVSSAVRSRAAQRIRQRNSRHLSDSQNELQTRAGPVEVQRHQQELATHHEPLKKALQEDSEIMDKNQAYGNHRQAFYANSSWLTWLNQAGNDCSFSDSDYSVGTSCHSNEFQQSSLPRNSTLGCRVSAGSGSLSNLSSDEETIKFTSAGSGSDSYHTADEWLVVDYIDNVIPDYRDRESKLYDALLKRDFCHGGSTYMYY